MSKSWKKFPCFTDKNSKYKRWSKRQASKKVRKNFKIDNGNQYKKLYNSYNITDYKKPYYYESEIIESISKNHYKKHQFNYKYYVKNKSHNNKKIIKKLKLKNYLKFCKNKNFKKEKKFLVYNGRKNYGNKV